MLISDPELRNSVGYNLPDIPNPQTSPERVRVRFVNSRKDARQYIAFKHITGPLKWDAYAKAKYAADWLKDGGDIDFVSRTLGDNHNTIRRLVNGFNVLEQAQHIGFEIEDRSKKRFSFSHLYTAVSRPAVREFLGLAEDAEEILTKDPVPKTGRESLVQLMSWLYGQESKKQPTLIISQNPNLNQLIQVIGHPDARAELLRSRSLDRAYLQIEPQSKRFKDALIRASQECEEALKLSTHSKETRQSLTSAKTWPRVPEASETSWLKRPWAWTTRTRVRPECARFLRPRTQREPFSQTGWNSWP